MAPKEPKDVDPGATGSIDVQFSGTKLPRAPTARGEDAVVAIPAEITGSMDVQFSSTAIPKPHDPRASGSVDVGFSQPIPVVRRRRATTVPGFIAESLANLPVVKEVMPKTRKARLMVRSMFVAFMLIGIWIGVIIYLQLRGEMRPDLRPQVEAIFGDLSDGKIDEVYEHASVRFQELTLAETFEHLVHEQNETMGPFVEVAAVIRTEMFRGPSGKTARADLLLDFENGRSPGNMSFIYEDGQWRMLGFSIELPEDVAATATSVEAREKRVQAPQTVIDLAVKILEQSRDAKSEEIYDAADQVFRDSVTREKFLELETQRRDTLGAFRFLKVTTAKQNPAADGATVDGIATFGDGGITQAISLKFKKVGGAWKLSFYKVILPMPHGPAKKP